MPFKPSSRDLKNLKEYKPILLSAVKIVTLFVAALYLLGFTLFPLLGVGNYQLVRVDPLLPFELFMLTCLSVALFAWSFYSLKKLTKKLKFSTECNTKTQDFASLGS